MEKHNVNGKKLSIIQENIEGESNNQRKELTIQDQPLTQKNIAETNRKEIREENITIKRSNSIEIGKDVDTLIAKQKQKEIRSTMENINNVKNKQYIGEGGFGKVSKINDTFIVKEHKDKRDKSYKENENFNNLYISALLKNCGEKTLLRGTVDDNEYAELADGDLLQFYNVAQAISEKINLNDNIENIRTKNAQRYGCLTNDFLASESTLKPLRNIYNKLMKKYGKNKKIIENICDKIITIFAIVEESSIAWHQEFKINTPDFLDKKSQELFFKIMIKQILFSIIDRKPSNTLVKCKEKGTGKLDFDLIETDFGELELPEGIIKQAFPNEEICNKDNKAIFHSQEAYAMFMTDFSAFCKRTKIDNKLSQIKIKNGIYAYLFFCLHVIKMNTSTDEDLGEDLKNLEDLDENLDENLEDLDEILNDDSNENLDEDSDEHLDEDLDENLDKNINEDATKNQFQEIKNQFQEILKKYTINEKKLKNIARDVIKNAKYYNMTQEEAVKNLKKMFKGHSEYNSTIQTNLSNFQKENDGYLDEINKFIITKINDATKEQSTVLAKANEIIDNVLKEEQTKPIGYVEPYNKGSKDSNSFKSIRKKETLNLNEKQFLFGQIIPNDKMQKLKEQAIKKAQKQSGTKPKDIINNTIDYQKVKKQLIIGKAGDLKGIEKELFNLINKKYDIRKNTTQR